MYEIAYSQKARKAIKRFKRSGSFPWATLKELLTHFINGNRLPIRFKDHVLHGDLSSARECHLGFNLLLQYEKDEILRIITVANIGTHAELFGE